jgi:hypothetical protein
MPVREAQSWSEVEAVAAAVSTCVRPGGQNWEKAKQTWEQFRSPGWQPQVRYFIRDEPPGYVRLLLLSSRHAENPTWCVDFVKPPSYQMVLAVREMIGRDGKPPVLLCKGWDCVDSNLSQQWTRLNISIAGFEVFPYSFAKATTTTWMVVPVVDSAGRNW